MSDISRFEDKFAEDLLATMPSETATDVDDIPDQTPLPDMDEEEE